jgi:zinc protease
MIRFSRYLLLATIASSAVASGCGTLLTSGSKEQTLAANFDVEHEKFVLPNGLTLIVHEDDKAPLVSVNVWYHVGSQNELPEKTGFAHLFEHLMFNGSEHYNKDYFRPFEEAGAVGMNGTTSVDRTNYYQTVPTPALDMALWMESDRMGHFLGALDQAKLDEQIEVVLNEKSRGDNQPYGKTWEVLSQQSYPAGHPYSWRTIGSEEHIRAFKLETVKDWFKQYYGAANAVLVVAGDVEATAVYEKVKYYFGNIEAGPPLTRPLENIAEMTGPKRVVMQDNVPQAKIYLSWNVPRNGSPEADHLNLFSDVLSTGKNSRLYQRLVYKDQIATDVSAFIWQKELGSQFVIVASAKPEGDLAYIEKVLREELADALNTPPTSAELRRIRNGLYAGLANSFQQVGGKSALLAASETYFGDPDAWKEGVQRLLTSEPSDIQATAKRWLHERHLTLEVHPFGKHSVSGKEADRRKIPSPGKAPDLRLPKFQHAELSNGLKVILAERHDAPTVNLTLQFNGGYAADKVSIPGLASFTMSMLDEGTATRDSLQIAAELDELGSGVGASAGLDTLSIGLNSLTHNLPATLDIFADVLLNAAFPDGEVERLRNQFLAGIKREQSSPQSMALRVLPPLIFGDTHAYGQALTGSGTEAGVASITIADMQAFKRQWLRPDNGTLMVVGDTTLDSLLPQLESRLAAWSAPDEPLPELPRFAVGHRPQAELYIVDRPNSPQSMIVAGHIAPSAGDDRNIAMNLVNKALGGMFTSRLNMNLREDKGWSYGASSTVVKTQAQRMFLAYASVQQDKTAESISEIRKELRGVAGGQQISSRELELAKSNIVRKLPGNNETQAAVLGTLSVLNRFGLPDDYYDSFVSNTVAVSQRQVNKVAADVLEPERVVWVVVGDRQKIEKSIKALGIANIQVIDVNGNRVKD